MAPKKKTEATGTTVENALSVMGKMAKKNRVGGVSFTTVAESADNWRFIDFVDPKVGLPALCLEWLWGARGLLTGRLLKIEAEEGVGKSSYCMLQYGMGQVSSDAWCVHLEGEEATAPPDFAASFGCDPGKIMMPRFDVKAIDECFNKLDMVAHYIRRAAANEKDKDVIDPGMLNPIIAGIDSISSFGTAANMDDEGGSLDCGSGGLGLHSRFLSQWFRDKWTVQVRRQMLLMAVTQLREKIDTSPSFPGAPKGPKGGKTTIAARPLNYHASYRLEMRAKANKIQEGNKWRQVGELVTMKTTKNKLSPKGKELVLPLTWDAGFDLVTPTVDLLASLGTIQLRGGYEFAVKKTGQWLQCPSLREKSWDCKEGQKYEGYLDFLNHLYSNVDMVMCIREALRIRGYGFEFETNYIPTPVELADIEQPEAAAAEAVTEDA